MKRSSRDNGRQRQMLLAEKKSISESRRAGGVVVEEGLFSFCVGSQTEKELGREKKCSLSLCRSFLRCRSCNIRHRAAIINIFSPFWQTSVMKSEWSTWADTWFIFLFPWWWLEGLCVKTYFHYSTQLDTKTQKRHFSSFLVLRMTMEDSILFYYILLSLVN